LSRLNCGTTSTSLELFDPDVRQVLGRERGLEALLVGFAPWIVDQDQSRLLGAVFLDRIVDQRDVDEVIDRRYPEHVVLSRAVLGDRRAGRPYPHEGYLGLVGEWHDRDRDGGVEAAEQCRDLLPLHEFARGEHALGGIALVIAHEQLDLLAEDTALSVDLIDGQ
jgi:hypothetical protein